MASSLGIDIKEVLGEVGATFTISRNGAVINSDKCSMQANKQGSKPFTSEHQMLAQMSYDSAAEVGDVLQFTASGTVFFLMTKKPELFEDEVIAYNCILYSTNAVASFSRVTSGVRDPQTYQMVEGFVDYATGVPVLATDKMYGSTIDEAQRIGDLSIRSNEVIVPAWVGVKSLDRVAFSLNEFYKVEQIETRRYGGNIVVLTVTEDTRGA